MAVKATSTFLLRLKALEIQALKCLLAQTEAQLELAQSKCKEQVQHVDPCTSNQASSEATHTTPVFRPPVLPNAVHDRLQEPAALYLCPSLHDRLRTVHHRLRSNAMFAAGVPGAVDSTS